MQPLELLGWVGAVAGCIVIATLTGVIVWAAVRAVRHPAEKTTRIIGKDR